MKVTIQKMDETFQINGEEYLIVEEWLNTDTDTTTRQLLLIKKAFYDNHIAGSEDFELNDLILNSLSLKYVTEIKEEKEE